jgi:hypothetical protein
MHFFLRGASGTRLLAGREKKLSGDKRFVALTRRREIPAARHPRRV